MTIWLDVEDLIRFFQSASRPTGIQRFSFETCGAALRLAGPHGEVGFCRRTASGQFRRVHFPALESGIRALAERAPAASAPPRHKARPWSGVARHVAPRYRLPLGAMLRAGGAGLRSTRDLARTALSDLARTRPGAARLGGHVFDTNGPAIEFGPGDWLLNLGASWERPYDPAFLDSLAQRGAGLAFLAHDMIPDLFPEWCTASMVRDFDLWLDGAVPRADLMFAVSQNTAQDLAASLARRGKHVPPCVVLPAGGAMCQARSFLPPLLRGPYVLMVGTIEARKNHAGMLRVWRRLLATCPPDLVPTLVFAGKVGWLTADLMQQLASANYLNGKIRFIDQPSDTALASLYQHCLFTLFPSLYEGWGLPVTESLCFGKPVAASMRASIPEAGGAFCGYFDPDDLNSAYELIRGWIENPTPVAALSARIATGFTPPAWADTAAALLAPFLGADEPAIRLSPAYT